MAESLTKPPVKTESKETELADCLRSCVDTSSAPKVGRDMAALKIVYKDPGQL